MKKTHTFKTGFEVGEKGKSFVYQLTVVTKEIDIQKVNRLLQAVDTEYKKIQAEQCGME